MRNIISFSGGKDSTALILWAKENLESFDTIFCDTGWEDPITYEYVQHINETLLDGKLIILKSDKYDGMEDMCIQKGRAPSVVARFCTEQLKMIPTKKYIESLDVDVCLYVGIRADESPARAKLSESCWHDLYKCEMKRPLLKWTADDVFAIHEKYKVEPNPLYKMGMKRVGCMPCVLCGIKEMKSVIRNRPQAIEKVRQFEERVGKTFFGIDFIPEWAMKSVHNETGKKVPYIDDVLRYVQDNPDQEEMFELPSCMSYYNLCE